MSEAKTAVRFLINLDSGKVLDTGKRGRMRRLQRKLAEEGTEAIVTKFSSLSERKNALQPKTKQGTNMKGGKGKRRKPRKPLPEVTGATK